METNATNKIRIGWFSFSCCEDNLIVFTELMNERWQEWKNIFDFRHVRALSSKMVLDQLDIAFIEGAIAAGEQAEKLKDIRAKSKKLVAVGACACVGMPAGQRNFFSDEQKKEIEFLLARFNAAEKVLKVSDVVKVDAEVGGCPMDPNKFLQTVSAAISELKKS